MNYWFIQSIVFIVIFIFIFLYPYYYCWGGLNYIFGCDYMSFGLIMLRLWICVLIILARESVFRINYFGNLFTSIIIILLLLLVCTFRRIRFFTFYLFFERSLIPTLFLILGWGYQPERLQAGIYLLFYTLLASLPLLVGIIYLYDSNNLTFFLIEGTGELISFFFYIRIILAFLVKIPIFSVHLWLPKAHVEAPVRGSIILAGILLKLGGYGLLRVYNLLIRIGCKINFIWVSVRVVGGTLVSLICMRQTDLKSLIAYSSVAHIGIVIGGLMTLTYWGYCGSYTLIIAHGLCSSGLFCLANITYERLGSRRLMINRGLLNFIPRISLWWFLLRSCNMAAPPSINLLGEIRLLNRIVGWSFLLILILIFLSFFRAAYTLYIFSYRQHGQIYSGIYSCSLGYTREYALLFLHWFPLNLLIVKGDVITLWLYLDSLIIKF